MAAGSHNGGQMQGEIYAKLAAITSETDPVGKDRKNTQQGYNFRGIDDLVGAVRKAMAKHGVTCVPSVQSQERFEYQTKSGGTMHCAILTVAHSFFASDGSSVTATTVGEGSDSGDKATNKAMSAAFKYALLPIFLLGGGEDSENDHPERASRAERARPVARVAPEPQRDAVSQPASGPRKITAAQRNRLFAIVGEEGKRSSLTAAQAHEELRAVASRYGYESSADITTEHYDKIIADAQTAIRALGPPADPAEEAFA